MLFLLFQLGEDRYALDALQVVAVLPVVSVKQIPHAPPGIAGVIDFHGSPVPLIDLSQLALGRPAQQRLSTRIILVFYPHQKGKRRLLGLLAEKATETMRRAAEDFVVTGVGNDAAPYLGPVAADPRGLVQWIEVGKLLPPAVSDLLFKQTAAEQ